MKYFRLTFVLILIFGLGYPLLMTVVAQTLFFKEANGSLITNEKNQVIGSELIGQSFTKPEFFSGRISSIHYDASSSGSKNYAPSNTEMIQRTETAAKQWLKEYPGKSITDVPLDLITNSGSGLDPHISVEGAMFQVPRISKATGISKKKLTQLIEGHREGFKSGRAYVNVLKLNLDLQTMRTTNGHG